MTAALTPNAAYREYGTDPVLIAAACSTGALASWQRGSGKSERRRYYGFLRSDFEAWLRAGMPTKPTP